MFGSVQKPFECWQHEAKRFPTACDGTSTNVLAHESDWHDGRLDLRWLGKIQCRQSFHDRLGYVHIIELEFFFCLDFCIVIEIVVVFNWLFLLANKMENRSKIIKKTLGKNQIERKFTFIDDCLIRT
jgi:hypothetical protein